MCVALWKLEDLAWEDKGGRFGISLGRLLSQCKLLSHQLMAGY